VRLVHSLTCSPSSARNAHTPRAVTLPRFSVQLGIVAMSLTARSALLMLQLPHWANLLVSEQASLGYGAAMRWVTTRYREREAGTSSKATTHGQLRGTTAEAKCKRVAAVTAIAASTVAAADPRVYHKKA
jgi:hypothetical protein